jgi:predicted nucleic acid-binding protein
VTTYLDTSSLVKLYVDEPGADKVHALRRRSTVLATAVITYAEVRATFAAMRRSGALSAAAQAGTTRDFERDWPHLAIVPVDLGVCRVAGDLAERHGLRGFDSVHLACYLAIAEELHPAPVSFSSFDRRLARAAAAASRAARRRLQ